MGARPPLNFVTNTLSLAREALAGVFGLDAKRPTAWCQYGYPEKVEFAQLLQAYERGGLAQGAVHRLLDGCWQETPRIKDPASDAESAWEKKVERQFKDGQLWAKLRDLDRRNMIGRFAAIVYRVADSKKLSEPLEKATQLVDIVPLFESQIKVTKWVEDTNAENYGDPLMFQIETAPPGSDNSMARPRTWIDVHPSRVQLLAEGAVGSNFLDGVPLNRAGFNALIDIEKIAGGSGESFLKNSSRTVVFQYDPAASVQAITQGDGTTKTVREVHEEQTRNLNRNNDSSIVIQGGEAKTLQTTIADPKGPFDVAVSLYAASVRIPVTILIGQQTGRLASDEDRKDFQERCKSRQDSELTPMIEAFVRRMQACGVIDAGEFEIEWPELGAPTDAEKLDNLGKMTAAMQQASAAGLTEPLFDANELRKVVDYEERTDDGLPAEGQEGVPPGGLANPDDPAAQPPQQRP